MSGVGVTVAHDVQIDLALAGYIGSAERIFAIVESSLAQAVVRIDLQLGKIARLLPVAHSLETIRLVVVLVIDFYSGLPPAAGPTEVIAFRRNRAAHRESDLRCRACDLDEPFPLAAAGLGEHTVSIGRDNRVLSAGQHLLFYVELRHGKPVQEVASRLEYAHDPLRLRPRHFQIEIARGGDAGVGNARRGGNRRAGDELRPDQVVTVDAVLIEITAVDIAVLVAVIDAVGSGVRVGKIVHACRVVDHEQQVGLDGRARHRRHAAVGCAGKGGCLQLPRARQGKQVQETQKGQQGAALCPKNSLFHLVATSPRTEILDRAGNTFHWEGVIKFQFPSIATPRPKKSPSGIIPDLSPRQKHYRF